MVDHGQELRSTETAVPLNGGAPLDPGGPVSEQRRNQIIDAVYTAATDPTRWPGTLTILADYLDAHGGMLVRNAQDPERSVCILGGLPTEISELYVTEYTDNPWTRAAEAVPVGEVAVLSSLYDLREGRKLPWYADILLPTRTQDMAYLSVPGFTSPTSVGGLAFCFSESAAPEIHEAVHRLRELGPHLQRALWLSQQVDRARILEQRLDDLMSTSPRPLLMISARQRVVGMNIAAEALLRGPSGLTIDHRARLRAASPVDDAKLQSALLSAVSPDGTPPIVSINRPAHPPLRLLLSALPQSDLLPAIDPESQAVLLVTLIDPDLPQENKIESMVHVFGLSPGEARVAALLATGIGRDRAARRLDISVETVKKHTAACFRKTGVSSQAGLAHVVAALPIRRKRVTMQEPGSRVD